MPSTDSKTAQTADRQLTLHYLDKTHATLLEVGRTINLTSFFQILFSLVVIALSTGIVSASNEVSLLGLKIETSNWSVLFVCLLINGGTFTYLMSLFRHGTYMEAIILRLYDSLGFHDETLSPNINPFTPPDIPTLLFAPLSSSSRFVLLLILEPIRLATFLGLPLCAQLLISYRLIVILGAKWWLLVSLIALFTQNLVYAVVQIRDYAVEVGRFNSRRSR